jgi:hypothetical protein
MVSFNLCFLRLDKSSYFGAAQYWYAVQVSDTTMMTNDKMPVTKN